MHRIAAGAALVTHVVFVVFAVIGGFIAWLMPVVLIPHLAAAAWGGRMAATRRARCPLSVIENWGRVGSGREPLHERGFVAHYAEGRLYPTTWNKRVELLVVGLVAGSWLGLAMR